MGKKLENNIEITVLYEISKALSEHLELKRSLYKVLEILSTSTQMVRGTICLRDPVQDEIVIEVAHGLSKNAMRRGRYKIGEGITGRVIATGEAVTIPKISEEPLFLDRTASRQSGSGQEVSFICVPVKRGNNVIGALSVDRAYDET
ncbi:MAG: GAF domain-containing protein, partial [Deltaproteobacteria bacterium]|nr:GAF domain-containing protein [Deltaproteobacteria bacterium]